MNHEPETTRIVRSWLKADEHESADRVLGTVLDRIAATPQRRRPWRARRLPEMNPGQKLALGAAAVLVAALAGAGLMVGGSLPAVGGPAASPSPSPSLPSSTTPSLDWTGPLRPDSATMPVIARSGDSDGRDAAVGWIDIVGVGAGGPGHRLKWDLELAGVPPRASTLDPTQRAIEYGVVLDGNGDGVADCLVGISTDAPKRGDYRVWVTDLATGTTDEQVGPPYGYPIDFVYPDEQVGPDEGPARHMTFFFLGGGFAQCASVGEPMRYYAWASVTDAGRVTAWDYAPDAAWLSQPWPVTKP
jgi:hypothetical protein